MGPQVVWLLNFEADHELAHLGSFTASRELQRRVLLVRELHSARVMRNGDLLLDLEAKYDGLLGRAWCPTPSALAVLSRAGLRVDPTPALDVLRETNDRAFHAKLGQILPGGIFSHDLEQLASCCAEDGVSGEWVFKRAFGVAGRGQLRVRAGELGASGRAWLAASLKLGGVQLEPLVALEREFASHGWIGVDGKYEIRRPCTMECDVYGAWADTRTAEAGVLSAEESSQLLEAADVVARALLAAKYFGPFGVDAFRWRDRDGNLQLQARSEINARYTLGWRVSFPEL
ncbi:MAG: hypothetical protein ACI8X5_000652 [Planctomycetota bacterium]|jgi:hypothetical protein